MSFADLERGLGERAPLARDLAISPESDLEFNRLSRLVSINIHKINANVAAISKFIDLLGTPRDNADLRNKLSTLTEVTRDVVKSSTGDLKDFVALDISPADRQHKQALAKISSDYQHALTAFQSAQTRSAERQRHFVERSKTTLDNASSPSGGNRPLMSPGEDQLVELTEQRPQQQLQQQEAALSDGDLDFQEQLIQEREGEIEQIEQGIVELNQIFKDIGTLVNEQQSFVDEIQSNVYSTSRDTRAAAEQLTEAHASQKRAARRSFYLLLVFLIVLGIVLLAVLS